MPELLTRRPGRTPPAGCPLATVGEALEHLRRAAGVRSALVVVGDGQDRQVVTAGRRPLAPGWERRTACAAGPGVHTDPPRPDLGPELEQLHRLAATSLRRALVEAAAGTDPLTGLLTRRALVAHVAARMSAPTPAFTLTIIDPAPPVPLDEPAPAEVRDELVRRAAGLLRRHARPDDVVGRADGQRLALVQTTPDPDLASSRALTERLRGITAAPPGAPWPVSGVARWPAEASTPGELWAVATERLERARRV
ncbi:MAG: hypothetical protein IPM45_16220 [Acidimicrobiales bacterium]|nr:hypothetical protein [Acidimicrobiales bacterium]